MVAKDFKTNVLPVSSKLFRFAANFLRNEDDARDVVQDIFLKLWQKKDGLDKIDNIEAFAMRMTRNRCLDVIRARKVAPINGEVEKYMKETATDVHLGVELSESASIIQNLIEKLPDVQRTVMLLRDIEQYSYDEIAEVTDLQINAIRVNLSRARKKVREEFFKTMDNGTKRSKNIIATLF